VESLVRDRAKKFLNVACVPNVHLALGAAWKVRHVGGIPRQVSPADRVARHPVEQGVDVARRRRSKPSLSVTAAVLKQLGVQSVQPRSRDEGWAFESLRARSTTFTTFVLVGFVGGPASAGGSSVNLQVEKCPAHLYREGGARYVAAPSKWERGSSGCSGHRQVDRRGVVVRPARCCCESDANDGVSCDGLSLRYP